MFTDNEKQEMKEIMSETIQEALNAMPKETDAQRKARIMSIKDPILRQKEISENMDLFRGGRK